MHRAILFFYSSFWFRSASRRVQMPNQLGAAVRASKARTKMPSVNSALTQCRSKVYRKGNGPGRLLFRATCFQANNIPTTWLYRPNTILLSQLQSWSSMIVESLDISLDGKQIETRQVDSEWMEAHLGIETFALATPELH